MFYLALIPCMKPCVNFCFVCFLPGPGKPPPPVSLDGKPQNPGRSVVHKQFNSPMGLYNDRTVVNTLENKMDKFHLRESRESKNSSPLSQNERFETYLMNLQKAFV